MVLAAATGMAETKVGDIVADVPFTFVVSGQTFLPRTMSSHLKTLARGYPIPMGGAGLCPLPIGFGLQAIEASWCSIPMATRYSFRRVGDGHDDGPGTVPAPRAEREFADRKTVRELAQLRPGKLGSTK